MIQLLISELYPVYFLLFLKNKTKQNKKKQDVFHFQKLNRWKLCVNELTDSLSNKAHTILESCLVSQMYFIERYS